ncbi:hypothetical protein ABZ371_25110, partial [Streptomyces sp. NPDC005899]|uniref:hypothetical protein n=1 Tax=Streptomyces sp. NPDC005899 TaxID=3155716 RepID=UPI0033C5EE54
MSPVVVRLTPYGPLPVTPGAAHALPVTPGRVPPRRCVVRGRVPPTPCRTPGAVFDLVGKAGQVVRLELEKTLNMGVGMI